MNPTPHSTDPDADLDFGPTLRGLRAGLKVFERYQLVRQLGRGGMGVVWLARDAKLDLEVALKFLPENLVHDEVALADLRRETRRCMKLHHTHIVHVYDLVDDDFGAAIAMEYVEGKSLSALRLTQHGEVYDVETLLPLLRQMCEALGYAHEEAQVVHYDLKPANFMVNSRGVLKVMDFGIATSIGESNSRRSQGAPTAGMGTPQYMSPQQLTGYPPAVSDDVYSLGATIYELLTGKPPFYQYRDRALDNEVLKSVPPLMSARRKELGIESASPIPEAWERVVAACLDKEPENRPRSVAEVWQRLKEGNASAKPAAIPKREVAREEAKPGPALKQPEAALRPRMSATKKLKMSLALLVPLVVFVLLSESLSRRTTVKTPTPPAPIAASLAEQLIHAWDAVHAQNDAAALADAKKVFQSASTDSDLVTADEGTAGLAAVAAIEAAGVQTPARIYPISNQPLLGPDGVSMTGSKPWGFMDHRGQQAIPPQWDDVLLVEQGFFEQGFAMVKQAGQVTCIDREGKPAIPGTWENLSYREGLFLGKEPGESGRWRFMDRGGNTVLASEWEQVWPFHEGLAAVKKAERYGFIDRSGELVIQPTLRMWIRGFHEGLLGVQDGSRWGFMDRSGKVVIPYTYEAVESFSQGLAPVKMDGKWGYVDRRGTLVIPAIWDETAGFSEGLAPVKQNGLWGCIDRTGKLVIAAKWEFVGAFKEGLASVGEAGRCGFINHEGSLVIPTVWDSVWTFLPGGVAALFERLVPKPTKDGETVPTRMCYIDTSGKVLWSSDGKGAGELAKPLNTAERQPPGPSNAAGADMPAAGSGGDFDTGKIGDTRVVDLGSGVMLTLCCCPAGSFTMGSPASEADRLDDEDQVQVKISRDFWLAKTECTQAQWRVVMGTEPSTFKGDELPVESVSWEDAQEFMVKLNQKKLLPSGWQWSLPSEAQWEYACRAGTTGPYAGELHQMAWYAGNSGTTTHPVGSYGANAWGLQDMHGNVYEWCSDWYGDKLPGGTDPTGASSGSYRVIRGGAWINFGHFCRSAYRYGYVPGSRIHVIGFRVASVPVERSE